MLRKLTYFSIDHPKLTVITRLLVTIFFMFQFPKIKIDTDLENMLETQIEVE